MIRRREFIAGLGGAAVAWPLAAPAQTGRMRRVAVLTIGDDNPATQAAFAQFSAEMAKLGWIEGRNLRLDIRFGASDTDRLRAYATELVNLGPDVIVATGSAAVRAAQEKTPTIPIVIFGAGDVFANGVVKNIAHPEGNITGVTNLFGSIGGKWLELLKEAMPRLERVAFIHPDINGGGSFLLSIEEAARVYNVQAIEISFHNAVDLVRGIDAFAADPNGGLIIAPPTIAPYREAILTLAAQHRLPTVVGINPRGGALIGYAPLLADAYRRGAFYVDRLLRGAKVSELPVEYPTRFELVVNLKTAKAIGLTIPELFLVRADEVIEADR
jgi:putative ABC transport system substrate-binding protein